MSTRMPDSLKRRASHWGHDSNILMSTARSRNRNDASIQTGERIMHSYANTNCSRLTKVATWAFALLCSGAAHRDDKVASTSSVAKMIRAIHVGTTIGQLHMVLPPNTPIGNPNGVEADQALANFPDL